MFPSRRVQRVPAVFSAGIPVFNRARPAELHKSLLQMEVHHPDGHVVESGLYSLKIAPRGRLLIVIWAAGLETCTFSPFASSPSDQLLRGERVGERQRGADGSDQLPPVCDPSQHARLHLAGMAQLSVHL